MSSIRSSRAPQSSATEARTRSPDGVVVGEVVFELVDHLFELWVGGVGGRVSVGEGSSMRIRVRTCVVAVEPIAVGGGGGSAGGLWVSERLSVGDWSGEAAVRCVYHRVGSEPRGGVDGSAAPVHPAGTTPALLLHHLLLLRVATTYLRRLLPARLPPVRWASLFGSGQRASISFRLVSGATSSPFPTTVSLSNSR